MIIVDTRWRGPYGIGRFSSEVIARLEGFQELKDGLSPVAPLDALWSSIKISQIKPPPKIYFTPGYTPPLWCSIPFVFTICDLNHIDLPENSDKLKRAYYRYIMRPACHRAFRVLTISEFSRKRIIDWSGIAPDQVVNVGCGVGGGFQPYGIRYNPGFPYLLHIGNHRPHKNVGRLLEAFSRSGLKDHLKLILSGVQDSELTVLIRKWNLEEAVLFAGLIPDDDLPAFYRGATALVLPSLYEGFGLPVIEAMACGTPVLTSNTTSLPEVAGDAAILVDPLSVNEISIGIERLYVDHVLRKALHRKGVEQAAQFSWTKVADRVKAVLNNVEKIND